MRGSLGGSTRGSGAAPQDGFRVSSGWAETQNRSLCPPEMAECVDARSQSERAAFLIPKAGRLPPRRGTPRHLRLCPPASDSTCSSTRSVCQRGGARGVSDAAPC